MTSPTTSRRSASSFMKPIQIQTGVSGSPLFLSFCQIKLIRVFSTCQVIDKPPFEVTETGWGEFEIQIKIYFISEASEKVLTVHHLLKLHPWTVSPETGAIIPMPETGPGSAVGQDGQSIGANGPSLDVVPVHSWQYDEVVFQDPTEALYSVMMGHPPTLL